MMTITFHNHYNQRITKKKFSIKTDVGTSNLKMYVNNICSSCISTMIIRFLY